MNASSHIIDTLQQGVILHVTIDDFDFRAYVVVSEPDVNRVADFVPADQFEQDGDLHVTAVGQAADARDQVQDITFNMNPGDAAVFLCADSPTYDATLAELGQPAIEQLN
jgi:hypothetical protein